MRLLIYQYDTGSIPGDMASIARIAPSAKKSWALISKKFVKQPDGTLINEVMAEIRSRRLKKIEKLSDNGSKGGRPTKKQMVSSEESNSKANGLLDKKQMDIQYNLSIVSSSNYSEGGVGETEEPVHWNVYKKNFMDDGAWQIKFSKAKHLTPEDLTYLMRYFVVDLELKQDYKPFREIQKHFTNWFNKVKPNVAELKKTILNGTTAKHLTAREEKDQAILDQF